MKITRESLEKSLELAETYVSSDYTGAGFDPQIIKALVQAHIEALEVIHSYADEDSWCPSSATVCSAITNGDESNWSLDKNKYVGGHRAREFLSKHGGVE